MGEKYSFLPAAAIPRPSHFVGGILVWTLCLERCTMVVEHWHRWAISRVSSVIHGLHVRYNDFRIREIHVTLTCYDFYKICFFVGWRSFYQLLSVSGFLLSANGYTLDGSKMEKTTLMSLQLRQLQDIIYRLNGIRLDSTEYACLKALLLFKPGKSRPLQERAIFIDWYCLFKVFMYMYVLLSRI